MSADPFIQAPENLQSHNRYAYVMNNPLNQVDPSGYKSLWMKIRGTVIRAIAAVADGFGCAGFCSAAVGAYQGYKTGGGIGALIGGVTGYLGYQFGGQTVEAYAVRAVGGCLSASAAGGSCGRGAIAGSLNHYGGAQGFWGSVTAGCISARVSGGSCGDGAVNAAASEAVTYVVESAVKAGQEIYAEAERMARQENHLSSRTAGLFLVAIPPAVEAGFFLWRSFVVYTRLQAIGNVLNVNGADTPKGQTDTAIDGLTGGLNNETDSKGRPTAGQYVKPGGDAQQDLDALPGTAGSNGQKTLPDGSVAGIHTSTTTGLDTLHVHRPRGSRDIKIRYPE